VWAWGGRIVQAATGLSLWAAGHPLAGNDCAVVTANGTWLSVACESTAAPAVVCQGRRIPFVPSASRHLPSPPTPVPSASPAPPPPPPPPPGPSVLAFWALLAAAAALVAVVVLLLLLGRVRGTPCFRPAASQEAGKEESRHRPAEEAPGGEFARLVPPPRLVPVGSAPPAAEAGPASKLGGFSVGRARVHGGSDDPIVL